VAALELVLLVLAEYADDRGGDFHRPVRRPVCVARRTGERRRVERAGLSQAVRDVDLGRLHHHGARRLSRAEPVAPAPRRQPTPAGVAG
jgi:hypothetical protein